MSKKKSAAWDRKTRGHISKGVVNYGRIDKYAKYRPKYAVKHTRNRRAEREIIGILDHNRQREEANLNWDYIALLLKFNPGMTLEQAKGHAKQIRRD
jgi:hypothetical protein